MKRFYFIFLGVCVIFIFMMYYSIWWFLGGVATIMAFTIYRFHAVRLEASQARNERLELQVEQLNTQLDQSMSTQMSSNREIARMKHLRQELLSVMSHEIRTPMNGIMGMGLLLKETSLNSEQREYANTICNCGESLLTKVNEILADDILQIAKINTEEQKLELTDFDLRNVVEEILGIFSANSGSTSVEMMYNIDENVPIHVIGDTKRLQQVLMNLLENAVKFTEEGEICLNVHTLIHGVSKPELIFEVRDTGAGISAEQAKRLFQGIPGKESSSSPGLGLVVCKKLVDLMGGYIDVKSELGKGSHFIFTIPLMASLTPLRAPDPGENIDILEGKRVLIAQGNSTLGEILSRQFQSWKMIPTLSCKGKEVIGQLAEAAEIDLVVIDFNIHDVSAYDLGITIRKQYPNIPLVLLDRPGNEARQEDNPFSFLVEKPIRQRLLRESLVHALSKRSSAKQLKEMKLSEEFAQQHPLQILIAEDNVVNQKLAMKMLSKLGYQPQLANNGKEVMEMVSQKRFDIVLMDVQMPEMDGLEATRMIRTCLEIQPVIIAMTANVMMGDRDECMQAGMDDYISKPFQVSELLGQLEKWHGAISKKQ